VRPPEPIRSPATLICAGAALPPHERRQATAAYIERVDSGAPLADSPIAAPVAVS
jgi:hypothetical protein